MKNKITLEELSAYFPYKVKAKFKLVEAPRCRAMVIGTVGEIYNDASIVCHDTVNSCPEKYKLMLRPMSWLTDEVISDLNLDVMDAIAIEEIRDKQVGYWNAPYNVIQNLFKNHIDLFGLIEKGLAEAIKD
jgi:hypothetical protein